MKTPDVFDGSDPSKFASFMSQIYLHIADRVQDFPTDDEKIFYVRSYLRGTAQKWFEPSLYVGAPIPHWDGNFALFVQELQTNFGPHDPVGDAEAAIKVLTMKTNDKLATYQVEFDALAGVIGWDDNALRSIFYSGLPRRIKDEMMRQSYTPTLAGVKLVARIIDARYWQRDAERKIEQALERSGGQSSSKPAGKTSGRCGSSRKSGQRQGKGFAE